MLEEYCNEDDIKALKQLIPLTEVKESKAETKESFYAANTEKPHSVRGARLPFTNKTGQFDLGRPDLNLIKLSAQQAYNFGDDLDNSDEDDLDDD